jgi:phosphohistidine phosphatase
MPLSTCGRVLDLYLVRHAIADSRDPARWPDDSQRPLTDKGIARFRRAARGLHRLVPEVDVVLSSPYTRAWQTAEILEQEAGWPAPERCHALEPGRLPAGALDVLKPEISSVVLVGHEPYLSRLASLLLSEKEYAARIDLKKGAVIRLDCVNGPRPGGAVLRWSATPRMLRALDER